MTQPDAPLAQVRTIGPSEIVSAVGLVSSLLIAVLGHDFGIGAQAQAIATVGVVVIPPFLGLIRAHKHGSAMAANAAVTVAQLTAGTSTPSTPPPPAVALTPTGPVALRRRPRGEPGGGQFLAEAPTRTTGE